MKKKDKEEKCGIRFRRLMMGGRVKDWKCEDRRMEERKSIYKEKTGMENKS